MCTVSGTSVTLLTTGTCTIQADQAGNGSLQRGRAGAAELLDRLRSGRADDHFAPIADTTLAQSPVTVSATASSGLPVSFSSSTTAVCTVSGTSVTLLTPGTCTIQADQAGNASYNAAHRRCSGASRCPDRRARRSRSRAVADATLAQSPVTVSATASSGLTVSFSSLTTAVCTVSGTSVTLLTIGTCTIQADQAGNGSFNAAPSVRQSFAVTAEPRPGSRSTRPSSRTSRASRPRPPFSTTTAGDLLVAFVGSDGPTAGGQTMTVTGAGLDVDAGQAHERAAGRRGDLAGPRDRER